MKSEYHLFQPIRCLFRPLKMPKYDNLRPLITPKRLHLISGAWKSQKGAISGPWKCQKSFISGPWKLQKGFSWFQGPEKGQKGVISGPWNSQNVREILYENVFQIANDMKIYANLWRYSKNLLFWWDFSDFFKAQRKSWRKWLLELVQTPRITFWTKERYHKKI